jgi:hypothetical protein
MLGGRRVLHAVPHDGSRVRGLGGRPLLLRQRGEQLPLRHRLCRGARQQLWTRRSFLRGTLKNYRTFGVGVFYFLLGGGWGCAPEE